MITQKVLVALVLLSDLSAGQHYSTNIEITIWEHLTYNARDSFEVSRIGVLDKYDQGGRGARNLYLLLAFENCSLGLHLLPF